MPLIAAMGRSRLGQRGAIASAGISLAAALAIATLSNNWLARAVSEGISDSIQGVKTVAAMLAERSPGERPEGALANLKPKRKAALHERALPKVRGPSAYETLAGPPPERPIAPLPEGPLYNAIAGGPEPIVPVAGGGGPPALSNIPLPGSGGGGFFSPPVSQATPETPPTPDTPASPVPEPATWTMMILGFAIVARALRLRRSSGAALPAR